MAMIFEFTKYEYQPSEKRILFYYATKFDDNSQLDWKETILLSATPDQAVPKKLLEALHIMLGISYWKFHAAPGISLPYRLSKGEADFWNTVYKKGLGEFFFKNNLDPSISPKFTSTKNQKPETVSYDLPNRSLVGIGGGKDSIVAAELLKEGDFAITAFAVENNPSPIIEKIIQLIGSDSLKLQRVLDEKVHQKHPYNGHIPVSAIYAFLGIFSCLAYGYRYFIVGNEHSSNFGNLNYKGLEINHQWSKSFEFEALFQEYVKNIISKDVLYFSLLRPFYEIRIVTLFTKHKKYFPYFSSCNKNFRIKNRLTGKLWCCQCAKCVFAWAMFSASLPKKEMLKIFGKDLSKEKSLRPLFKDIAGQGTMKPFDCVGTFEEVQDALGIKKHPEVWQIQKENSVPEQYKLLGMETAQIVRAEGIEGQATKKFLKKYYPKLKIVTENADITIKTPGIHKSQIPGYYTTPTNIFFSRVKGKNTIIGVTGSKGKSTTTSLVYHILKAAGKKVEIMGNIGIPMIERLIKPVSKDTLFVLELSSFQLDDIKFSPDIAVITNLFPEHMDFHGSLEAYYAAKKNIFAFQSKDDHLIFCVKAKQKYETHLLGKHNQNNIEAAARVARILKIPEVNIKKAVKSFKGLEHRLENVGTFKGITFYDDAISTTPDSTIMAIEALKKIGTIFLGGQDRGYDFKELRKTIMRHKIKNIVLFPDSGRKIIKFTKGLHVFETKSMEEAVKFAYENTEKGSVCLLSCASPSFSLWKNFEVKGNEFKKFIKKFSQ